MAGAGPPHYAPWPPPPGHNPPSMIDVDEVRTIFILGFPPDAKERELQNLLRWWPGYEASQMNFKGEQPMGFALFSSAAAAMAAKDALQNLVFDYETNSTLRAEMAKKNLYVKRGVTGMGTEAQLFDQSKRLRTAGDYTPHYGPPGPFGAPSPASWVPQSYMSPLPAGSYDPYASYGMPPLQSAAQPLVTPVAPVGYVPMQNMKDNPPCNTLFVGNLGENTSEAELRGIFSGQPGFKQMKVLRQGRNTDVNSAVAVHNNLQGAIVTSSDRGGMRLQYSKNPFGRKRDFMNNQDGGAPGVTTSDTST
ncbi:hypothetical protein KP509_13G094100 [Ceratopteris richardii]|uniref:RRM domain-containing protein n=1 Tax=Ceratopteris richardii TaxID=49495 RepID=A0A8T2TJZ5_CERRI|nr:hypothetical protein KP509_13G094100 [Ceratopteris richardii]